MTNGCPIIPQRSWRIGSMCTGYGGLDLAVERVLSGTLIWCAESDPAASEVLAAHFPGVPNYGDIRTVDWSTAPKVDIITAGFPCQDISNAGNRIGITGPRSGLWTDIAAALRHLRPRYVFLENVAAICCRGLDVVQADLVALGYDTDWLCLRASDIGAAHRRDRLFLLAALPSTATEFAQSPRSSTDFPPVSDTDCQRRPHP